MLQVLHGRGIDAENGQPLFHITPWLRHIFADGGQAFDKRKDALARIGKWTFEIIKRSAHARGLVLLPRRWRVERSCAGLNRNRRRAKDFERTTKSPTAWLFLASVQLITHLITWTWAKLRKHELASEDRRPSLAVRVEPQPPQRVERDQNAGPAVG